MPLIAPIAWADATATATGEKQDKQAKTKKAAEPQSQNRMHASTEPTEPRSQRRSKSVFFAASKVKVSSKLGTATGTDRRAKDMPAPLVTIRFHQDNVNAIAFDECKIPEGISFKSTRSRSKTVSSTASTRYNSPVASQSSSPSESESQSRCSSKSTLSSMCGDGKSNVDSRFASDELNCAPTNSEHSETPTTAPSDPASPAEVTPAASASIITPLPLTLPGSIDFDCSCNGDQRDSQLCFSVNSASLERKNLSSIPSREKSGRGVGSSFGIDAQELQGIAAMINKEAMTRCNPPMDRYRFVRDVFTACDTNGDGQISAAESTAFFRHFGLSETTALRFHMMMDRSGTGNADWRKFMSMFGPAFRAGVRNEVHPVPPAPVVWYF